MTCTFFGHRNCMVTVESQLKEEMVRLIEKENVTTFLVGQEGSFDRITLGILRQLKKEYPAITYMVVLSRIPGKEGVMAEETIFPEGLELVPPRFAIVRRNQWMLDRSDYVISYVRWSSGGAYTFRNMAIRKGKTVIDL